MRRFIHPGPIDATPSFAVKGRTEGLQRLLVPEGEDLVSYVEAGVRDISAVGAAFRLLFGTVARLKLMTGKPGDAGMIATFHGPHVIECPATVLGGHGAVGLNQTGDGLFSHSHAVFFDAGGRARGCHLIRNECIAGASGILVAIAYLKDARFRVRADQQTRFALFFPETIQ